MAAPVVAGVTEGGLTAVGTSVPVTLPAGGSASDAWIILLASGSTAASITGLAGWTVMIDESAQANGIHILRWFGSTLPTDPTFTLSASTRMVWIAYRLTGVDKAVTPQMTTTATGTSVNPGPGPLTPSAGSKDYLSIIASTMAGEEDDDDTWASASPAGYTPSPPRQKTGGTVGTNLGGLLLAAERAVTTGAAITPGSFTVAVSAAWRSRHLLIHPGAAGPATLFGAAALPVTYGQATAARRRTTSAFALPATFGAVTAGQATAGGVTHYGVVARASTFGAVTAGRRKAFGQVAAPSTFAAVTQARRRTTSSTATLVGFAAVTQARRRTFGAAAAPATFGAVTAARRRTFGQVARATAFGAVTAGRIPAAGPVTYYGALAMPVTLARVTAGRRVALGQVARATVLAAVTAGRRRTFGRVALDLDIDALVAARRRTTGRAALALTLTFETAGRLGPAFAIPPELAVTVTAHGRPVVLVAGTRPRLVIVGAGAAPTITAGAVNGRPVVDAREGTPALRVRV